MFLESKHTTANPLPSVMPVLYKLLIDGRSYNGGEFEYSLPTQRADGTWKPGNWHSVKGDIKTCVTGFHLTDDPSEWYSDGATVYVAEGRGDFHDELIDQHKIAYRSVRLLYPVEIKSEAAINTLLSSLAVTMQGIRIPDGHPEEDWIIHHSGAEMDERLFFNAPRYKNPAWNQGYRKYGEEVEAALDAVKGWKMWLARSIAEQRMRQAGLFSISSDFTADLKLFVRSEILCADLPLSDECRAFARASLNVWQKGYTNLGDMNGVLQVTAAPF